MRTKHLVPSTLAVAILAACGGGGDAGGGGNPPPPPGVTINGVAAKGALAHALVELHAIRSGAIDAAVVVQTESDASGHYTLPSYTPESGVRYVVVVKAKTDGTTTQHDEVTGQDQVLPADFALRAFLPTGDVQTEIHVTPFSELSVAAAQKAGLDDTHIAQAESNVVQLIGFDPRFVEPVTIDAAAAAAETPEKARQQQLAVLLTAVSQMAKDGSLGCTDADAGKKADCVVKALGNAYTVDSTKPGETSAVLSTAIGKVVADNSTKVGAAVVDTIVGSLSEQNTGTPATPGTADAIVATKALFNDLRTNVITLLGRGPDDTSSAMKVQADKFAGHVEMLAAPVDMLIKDANALVTGIELYKAFQAGTSTAVTVNKMFGKLDTSAAPGAQLPGVSCGLYTDTSGTVPATASTPAAQILAIGCSANYRVEASPGANVRYRHGFAITPKVDGSFEYLTKARKTSQVCNPGCTVSENLSISPNDPTNQAQPFKGTVTLTGESDAYTGLHITGELPATFTDKGPGTRDNPDGKATWTLDATRTSEGESETLAFGGKLTTWLDMGATQMATELEVKTGSKLVMRGESGEAKLDVVATAGQSRFVGAFSLGNTQPDKNGTNAIPLDLSLSGSFRNAAEAGADFVEFAGGSVSLKIDPTSYAAFDGSAADSADNQFAATLAFTGRITAPQRPALELMLSVSAESFDQVPTLTGKYTTLNAAGQPVRVLNLAGTEAAGLSVTEATSGISFVIKKDTTSTDVLKASTKVGSFDHDSHIVTFTNGDFVSFDFGL